MKRIGGFAAKIAAALLVLAGMLTTVPATAQDEAKMDEATAGQAATGHAAVLETSLGTMTFQLFPDEAPRTVANFERLVREGFYDGLPFYRVVAGHVIQTGDGGENDQPTVPLEAGGHPHVEGALGLARDVDPGSGSTEIYVCLADRPHLDGKYAVFGQLVDGFDVLRRIGAVEVTERWLDEEHKIAFHEPKEPVILRRAWLRDDAEGARAESHPTEQAPTP